MVVSRLSPTILFQIFLPYTLHLVNQCTIFKCNYFSWGTYRESIQILGATFVKTLQVFFSFQNYCLRIVGWWYLEIIFLPTIKSDHFFIVGSRVHLTFFVFDYLWRVLVYLYHLVGGDFIWVAIFIFLLILNNLIISLKICNGSLLALSKSNGI